MTRCNYSTKVVSTLKDKLYRYKSHYCRFLSHSSIRDGFLHNVHDDNNNNRIERRSFMSSSLKEFPNQKELLYQQQEILINDATKLSLSLYRIIVRSLRIIKISNEYDEVEFQRREMEQLEQLEMKKSTNKKNDTRYDMISMLPPVNRIDELRSRYEYYSQYAREQYNSEMNCLNPNIHNYHHNHRNNHRKNTDNNNNNGMDILLWNNQQMIEKFILILKRGNEQRQWLLRDMKYNIDPYENYYRTIYKPQCQIFEKNAIEFIYKVQQQQSMMDNNDNDISSMNHTTSRIIPQMEKEQQNHHNIENKDDDDDGWNTSDDEDDDVRTLPPWYKNPTSQ